jgi:hypothetical protein
LIASILADGVAMEGAHAVVVHQHKLEIRVVCCCFQRVARYLMSVDSHMRREIVVRVVQILINFDNPAVVIWVGAVEQIDYLTEAME